MNADARAAQLTVAQKKKRRVDLVFALEQLCDVPRRPRSGLLILTQLLQDSILVAEQRVVETQPVKVRERLRLKIWIFHPGQHKVQLRRSASQQVRHLKIGTH